MPKPSELFGEFARRVNPLVTRKNWLTFTCWAATFALLVPLGFFIRYYFSWPLLGVGFVYSMVGLGSFGTMWFHRYSTHRSFTFRNSFFRNVARNLAIKIVPEETYVLSHHVHHQIPEEPGDPYNAKGGFLYCFLADANHQPINRNLSERDYQLAARLIEHTGARINTYAQYQRWGSICHPARTILHYALSWAFWYAAFFLIGGHALATAIFGVSAIWAFGIRTFNYDGHGRGKDRRKVGTDFNRKDLSINQLWPGFVAGEWHNNHHLYPSSARSGFMPHQLDLPWMLIRFGAAIGWVSWFRDDRANFFRDHYGPYLKGLVPASTVPAPLPPAVPS